MRSQTARMFHSRLRNGVDIVGAPMEVPSVCCALYLKRGSLHEPPALNGISHFIEHLLFKGTQYRSAEEIGATVANLGAEANAFTWWLGVCCHARVLSRLWEPCLRLVCELMTSPNFGAEALEAERRVILEEIARGQGNPKMRAIQAQLAAGYHDHPLGRPIIGTEETVRSISLADVQSYYRQVLRPDCLTLTIAGRFQWDAVIAVAEEALGWLQPGADLPLSPPLFPPFQPHMVVHSTDLFKNVHLAYGFRVGSYSDQDYYPSQVLATLLGDEMRTSSRLLRSVQERGLAHEVFSSYQAFEDHGMLFTYAATAPQLAVTAHQTTLAEFAGLTDIGEDEVNRAKRKLISRIAVDGESSHKRALAVVRLFTGSGRLQSLEELCNRFGQVTADEVRDLVARYRPLETCIGVAVGPIGELPEWNGNGQVH